MKSNEIVGVSHVNGLKYAFVRIAWELFLTAKVIDMMTEFFSPMCVKWMTWKN